MIKIENIEVVGLEAAIRGMRNPMNSWAKSDSGYQQMQPWHGDNVNTEYTVGPNDYDLMERLAKQGPVHGKFRRMIVAYMDITAPLYWWKEFDTYKVGTVANSCSTMHKIHSKEFTLEDFSYEHLNDRTHHREWIEGAVVDEDITSPHKVWATPLDILKYTIEMLNCYRTQYLETKDKEDWWQMIQLLPSSYNQRRTVMLSYEVLANIYQYRWNHKLDEWREFCVMIDGLPYSEIIACSSEEEEMPSLLSLPDNSEKEKSMFRVIIAGGRDFADYTLLSNTMDKYLSEITDDISIVCGRAHGADTLGEQYAKEHGYNIQYFPAEWKRYGKAAGYIRNTEMAKNADALVAFWDGTSPGTEHMIATAEQHHLTVHVVGYRNGG